jgi:hypothetical protein
MLIKRIHKKKKKKEKELDQNIHEIVAQTGFYTVTNKEKDVTKQYMDLGKGHIRLLRMKNGVFTEEEHYRNGKPSSLTRWYHKDDDPRQGQYKQVVRNFMGMQFDVTGLYQIFESEKRSLQRSLFNY